MKRIGLRRVFPRLSYAIRLYLLLPALGQRALRAMTPDNRAKCIGNMAMLEQRNGTW